MTQARYHCGATPPPHHQTPTNRRGQPRRRRRPPTAVPAHLLRGSTVARMFLRICRSAWLWRARNWRSSSMGTAPLITLCGEERNRGREEIEGRKEGKRRSSQGAGRHGGRGGGREDGGVGGRQSGGVLWLSPAAAEAGGGRGQAGAHLEPRQALGKGRGVLLCCRGRRRSSLVHLHLVAALGGSRRRGGLPGSRRGGGCGSGARRQLVQPGVHLQAQVKPTSLTSTTIGRQAAGLESPRAAPGLGGAAACSPALHTTPAQTSRPCLPCLPPTPQTHTIDPTPCP